LSPIPHLAVVDDEVDITAMLAGYLTKHGFRVTEAASGDALFRLMKTDPADLVLLDLGLGGEDGLAVATHLKQNWRCGLVFLTGRSDSIDKVVGLEIGADDYVTKPFELRELVARIKAVLRRIAPEPNDGRGDDAPSRLGFAGWTLDVDARRLTDASGSATPLTGGEFDLLLVFARHPGKVLSRDFLLGQTRGREAGPFDRTIDVQVGRLRRKLEADPDDPQIIKSVRGAGYILVAPIV